MSQVISSYGEGWGDSICCEIMLFLFTKHIALYYCHPDPVSRWDRSSVPIRQIRKTKALCKCHRAVSEKGLKLRSL